ncbi:MAG: EamA/RhaT family transporter, partial [Rubricella sp.]
AAMRSSGFLVAVAYTKTEPVLVLIAVAILIGDVPGPGQIVAILVATGGVLLMSWPGEAARKGAWWRPLGLGLSAAALFALSAVGFGAAILALDHPGFIAAALTTLAIALTFQTAVLSAWLAWRKPGILRALLADPRKALPAGCTGAVASAFWFMAFALASPALVRTLALVEVFFSHIVGQRVLDERITRREAFGAALTTAGITGLFLSG